jgi:hypothetical protein
MAEIAFLLCTFMSAGCALILFRAYKASPNSLLLWSALAFSLLFLGNGFLCVDLFMFPNVELHGAFGRSLLTAASGLLLLYGLIMELS